MILVWDFEGPGCGDSAVCCLLACDAVSYTDLPGDKTLNPRRQKISFLNLTVFIISLAVRKLIPEYRPDFTS